MENMDKEFTVPKWVLIYLPNLSTQAQKFWISMKKKLHWASTVHVLTKKNNSFHGLWNAKTLKLEV